MAEKGNSKRSSNGKPLLYVLIPVLMFLFGLMVNAYTGWFSSESEALTKGVARVEASLEKLNSNLKDNIDCATENEKDIAVHNEKIGKLEKSIDKLVRTTEKNSRILHRVADKLEVPTN